MTPLYKCLKVIAASLGLVPPCWGPLGHGANILSLSPGGVWLPWREVCIIAVQVGVAALRLSPLSPGTGLRSLPCTTFRLSLLSESPFARGATAESSLSRPGLVVVLRLQHRVVSLPSWGPFEAAGLAGVSFVTQI